MRALALAVAALLAAGPLWAEKGDIYDCKFKLKRGQWLTEKVIAGIGHGSGKAKVYDKMLASADAEEGPKAFAEKRDPVWKGK